MCIVNATQSFESKLTQFQTMQDDIGRMGLLTDAKLAAEMNDINGLIFIMNMAEGKRGSSSRLLVESMEFGQWLTAQE